MEHEKRRGPVCNLLGVPCGEHDATRIFDVSCPDAEPDSGATRD